MRKMTKSSVELRPMLKRFIDRLVFNWKWAPIARKMEGELRRVPAGERWNNYHPH
jgi:hypothetical protein